MKTRNFKLSLLVIFLALCFTIYAGNCYSQINSNLFDTSTFAYTQVLDPLRIGYIDPGPYYPIDMSPYDYMWGGYMSIYRWANPAGKSTLDLLLDTVPNLNLTFKEFYGVDYKASPMALDIDYSFDYFGLPYGNLNVYQNPDVYALPLSQINTYYNFTKGFSIQPIMPDLWVGFGASYGGGMGGLNF